MRKRTSPTFWAAALVSIGGILYGYDIGVISGALLFIKHTIPMTDTQMGMVVAAVLAGGLIGTLFAGPVGDKYGRRFLIMVASIIFISGICFILSAHTFLMILNARLLLGIGVGVIAVSVPLYVAEIVEAADRGKYMNCFQLLITFGIVAAYFVDLLFTPSGNWRAMFGIVLVPAVILLFGIFLLPETPRWLIANNQIEKARAILMRLRPSALVVENDIHQIQASMQETEGHWTELFSSQFWLPTMVAVAVASFSQLTGINSFLQYGPLILKNAGMHSDTVTMMSSLGIGLLNFLATLFAMGLIDTWGRKPLLLIGIAGVIFSECFLGIISYLNIPAYTGLLSFIGLLIFIFSFAIGPGVVVWLAISELFPTRVRGKGISLCLFFHLLTSTFLSTFFLSLMHTLGMQQVYWLFAAFSFIYFLIAFFLLPETKTQSLEDIQSSFQKKDVLPHFEAVAHPLGEKNQDSPLSLED